jgi:hypothetical protein
MMILERPVQMNVQNDKMATVATFRKHKLHISVVCVILEFTLLFNSVQAVNICVLVWQRRSILLRMPTTQMVPEFNIVCRSEASSMLQFSMK